MTVRFVAIASDTAIEPVALSKAEAAAALGVSVDHLERHIAPDLRVIRSGRKVLIPVAELRRWVEENAETTLPPGGSR